MSTKDYGGFSRGFSRVLDTWKGLSDRDVDDRIRGYWAAFAAALFLLVPVDVLTTAVAAQQYGLDAVGNPFVAWLFQQGPVVFAGVQVFGVVIAGAFMYAMVESLRRVSAPLRGRLALVFEAWLGLLLSLGLFLLVNDVSAILLHASLL